MIDFMVQEKHEKLVRRVRVIIWRERTFSPAGDLVVEPSPNHDVYYINIKVLVNSGLRRNARHCITK